MSFITHTLAFTILTVLLIHSAYAEIYKCKSVNGQTIYSSKKCANTAEIFTPQIDHRPDLEKKGENKSVSEDLKENLSVDIYITSWCPYCKKAMAYLSSRDIPFNVHDIEKSPQAKVKKLKLAPGYTGIPLTVINGKILKGFSESRFAKALEK